VLRVIEADEDALLLEGLADLLERSGFDVVGQFANSTELVAHARTAGPTWSSSTSGCPPTHTTEGLDAARIIRDELPDTRIMVLSAHVDVEHAMELLAAGHGIGYLLKSRVTDVGEFIDALHRIAKGASAVDPKCWRSWRRDGPTRASPVSSG
jgi:DNA-binding NarL/FixJ family response regulator